MAGPAVAVDVAAITENARTAVARCRQAGVSVFGVVKGAHGAPLVARAMLAGGVAGLADSRLDNVRRLRASGITAPVMMLRIPSVGEATDVVSLCDISLNSERATLEALSQAAVEQGLVHEVVVMLEMGDRREGVACEDLVPLCAHALGLPGLNLAGIGANFMCASGVLPTAEKLAQLARHAGEVEDCFGIGLKYVSGGNSATLALMQETPLPPGINQLRVGAAILRGENPLTGGTLPGLRSDTFTLEADLVEIKTKHSMPEGETGADAFGNRLSFVDRGERLRGIVNLGRIDIRPEGLTARDPGIEVVTASSDHLIVDLTESRRHAVGDRLQFDMDYGALVQAMLSPYVTKRLVRDDAALLRPARLRILAAEAILAHAETEGFCNAAAGLGLEAVCGGAVSGADLPVWLFSGDGDINACIASLGTAAGVGLLRIAADPGAIEDVPRPETTALVGLLRATGAQSAFIRERAILAMTMEDVDFLGIREVMRRALARVGEATDGFMLVLDATGGRGMGADPLEAGLNYRECQSAMERIAASQGLRGIVLTGLGEAPAAATLAAAYGYMLSALGKRILA